MSGRWIEIPEDVQRDSDAQDVLRVWRVGEGQVFSVRLEHWNDPAAWGILLADLARHVARSFEKSGSHTESLALQRVLEGFHAELPRSP
jgi:hypothetical protein